MTGYETYQSLLRAARPAERPSLESAFQAGAVHAAETFRAYRELDEASRREPIPADPLSAFRSIFGL